VVRQPGAGIVGQAEVRPLALQRIVRDELPRRVVVSLDDAIVADVAAGLQGLIDDDGDAVGQQQADRLDGGYCASGYELSRLGRPSTRLKASLPFGAERRRCRSGCSVWGIAGLAEARVGRRSVWRSRRTVVEWFCAGAGDRVAVTCRWVLARQRVAMTSDRVLYSYYSEISEARGSILLARLLCPVLSSPLRQLRAKGP
jgi:hypothetical protein